MGINKRQDLTSFSDVAHQYPQAQRATGVPFYRELPQILPGIGELTALQEQASNDTREQLEEVVQA